MMIRFTIPLAPITKKNSNRIVTIGGRPRIIASKQYKDYEAKALWLLPKVEEPITVPVNVKCTYYMPTRRRVDLVNLLEATCDLMVKAGMLEDDNSTIVVSHDGSRVSYDKENPRTEVEITFLEDKNNA